jgi:hypothetical protein
MVITIIPLATFIFDAVVFYDKRLALMYFCEVEYSLSEINENKNSKKLVIVVR